MQENKEISEKINKIIRGTFDEKSVTPKIYYGLFKAIRKWEENTMKIRMKYEQVLKALYQTLKKNGHSIADEYKPML